MNPSQRVVIGMDPHKRSATIEVMTGDETIVGGGRFGTDRTGFTAMVTYAKQWPDRVWAIEGCRGIGRHLASRLVADGEQVVDVPPKLSARTRVFTAGQGRKTDATDAHSVALAATRLEGMHLVTDDALEPGGAILFQVGQLLCRFSLGSGDADRCAGAAGRGAQPEIDRPGLGYE